MDYSIILSIFPFMFVFCRQTYVKKNLLFFIPIFWAKMLEISQKVVSDCTKSYVVQTVQTRRLLSYQTVHVDFL